MHQLPTRFTMLSSISGKGTVSEEHPMNLGGLHGNGMPKIQQFYQTVDLMLAVGTVCAARKWRFRVKLRTTSSDRLDPLANGRTYANTWFACGGRRPWMHCSRIEGRMRSIRLSEDFRCGKPPCHFLTLGVYGSFPNNCGR